MTLQKTYKYVVIIVGISVSSIIATVSVLGYLKSTVKEAVISAMEPLKERVDELEKRVEKLIPVVSESEKALTVLTYRVNNLDVNKEGYIPQETNLRSYDRRRRR